MRTQPGKSAGLDYIFQFTEGEWLVWTPDVYVGAVIGVGKTKEEALRDAQRNMLATLAVMVELNP